jgi:HTH-type transcriptional regulator/antitoxin HigA
MATVSYADLLQKVQPEVIRDARTHGRALRTIDALMRKGRLSAAESKLLDLLAKLVDDYEETLYPTPSGSPDAMLKHFIDARGLTQSELARAVGIPRSTISEALKGKRLLSVENAFRIGKFFGVDPTLFLSRPVGSPA